MLNNYGKTAPKETALSIIIKIVVYVAFYALAIISSQSMFNMMPFTSELATLLQLGASKAGIIVKYIIPLVVAALYYLIYSVFARMAVNSTSRMLYMLGQNSDVTRSRIFLDSAVVLVAILKLLCDILFMFAPYIEVIAKPLFGIVIAISAIAFAVFGIAAKYEKKYLPIIFNSMIAPMILVCILA
ncbi:MAG: hypothetical protein RSC44_03900 [Clostridia bacterium]